MQADMLALAKASRERAEEVVLMTAAFKQRQAATEQAHLEAVERMKLLHLQHILDTTVREAPASPVCLHAHVCPSCDAILPVNQVRAQHTSPCGTTCCHCRWEQVHLPELPVCCTDPSSKHLVWPLARLDLQISCFSVSGRCMAAELEQKREQEVSDLQLAHSQQAASIAAQHAEHLASALAAHQAALDQVRNRPDR